MIGSSKGGTAALFYAINCHATACIIGAPQYRIGKYLSTEKHIPILKGIMGSTDETAIKKLDDLISSCITSKKDHKPDVYIHYSPEEHTYVDHIAELLTTLNENGYKVIEDNDYIYEDHGDVAKHFPKYILKVLQEII